MKRLLICCYLISILLMGCSMPFFAAPPGLPGPQAWIDQPLDGSALPLAPVARVAHCSDPFGLDQLEFTIDGTVVAEDSDVDSDRAFRAYSQSWSPASAGTYTLRVRARNAGGAWGSYASAVFTIGADALTVTPATEPTSTISPVGTMTPTASPTAAGINFTVVEAAPSVFYHSKGCGPNDPNCQTTCSPNQIAIRVQVSVPELVKSVVLFFSLAGKKSSTGWNEGVSMHPLENGVYEYNLLADHVPDAKSFAEATFKYQFVATDDQENIRARSQGFSDITMSASP